MRYFWVLNSKTFCDQYCLYKVFIVQCETMFRVRTIGLFPAVTICMMMKHLISKLN